MNRAFAVLKLKAVDGQKRTFSGVATTPATDRAGDIIEPKGAKFKLPLPLLWQHDSYQPIGWVTRARVSSSGIEIDGEIADIPDGGTLKDRLTEAWQSIQATLVRGLSIGFTPLEMEPIDPKNPWGPCKFLSWEWLELSAVTIPANQDATITTIKSIDDRLRLAAPGRKTKSASTRLTNPARAGAPNLKETNVKTYTQETLAGLQETRKTKAARMEELRELKSTETRRFTDDERTEFDGLDAEVEDLDDEITVTQRHLTNISKAKPVDGSNQRSAYGFVKTRDPDDKFKGQSFTRMVKARALAYIAMKGGSYIRASEIAEKLWGKSHPMLVAVIKANEVPGGGSGSGEWGSELVAADTRYTDDFVQFLYAATIFDRLPLREVPANIRIKGQDGQATGYWVGQSKAIPNSQGDFSFVDLAPLKVAALAVASNELLADSSPAADTLLRDMLVEASAQRVDTTFFSTDAASAGVSPAGILQGLSATVATGANDPFLRADIKSAYAPFFAAKNASGIVIAMQPALAKSISLMNNALGQTIYPNLKATGGELLGDTVFTGDNVPAGDMILLQPKEIWKIGDTGVQISISQEAMIEQSSAPTGATDTPVAASQVFTSMFQEESTAIKVVRRINFQKRRSSAVSFISSADYGLEES